jgi:hypothetical protein
LQQIPPFEEKHRKVGMQIHLSQLHPTLEEHSLWLGTTKKGKIPYILFVKLKVHTFEVIWIQSSLVGRLCFLTDETVCISLIEMDVILVVVDIQNIHENKNMT